ncbi:hypothetical protein GS424_010900 [Eggerthella guodeyinii]|uniref:Up-regulated in Daf-2 domain-containing protein n=1 Tax=Eggerthella guodeyinii TaxID=2690837 RepID=A0A6L7IRM9_9ACTN|nr:hypothetical protein [Eggerthella guodeyinii]QOS67052.1 hypothetical protein GS424_010900 [Eggerthella guodeyinii]
MSAPHMTRVAIANRSGVPLLDARVIHVFGDEQPEVLTWSRAIESGEGMLSDTKNVSYATGFGNMTDNDWWLVSWETEEAGQRFVCATTPSMFNLVSNYFIMQGGDAIGATVDVSDAIDPSDTAKSMSKMGGSLAKLLFGGIARKVDKSQLKEHVLKEEDAYDPLHPADIGLKLVVGSDMTVTFESPSGNSKADYTKVAVPNDLVALGY